MIKQRFYYLKGKKIKFPRNLKKLSTREIKKKTVKLNFNEVVFDSTKLFQTKFDLVLVREKYREKVEEKGSFLRILSGKITEKLTKVREFFLQNAARTLQFFSLIRKKTKILEILETAKINSREIYENR